MLLIQIFHLTGILKKPQVSSVNDELVVLVHGAEVNCLHESFVGDVRWSKYYTCFLQMLSEHIAAVFVKELDTWIEESELEPLM
jgi:hypothetical protein